VVAIKRPPPREPVEAEILRDVRAWLAEQPDVSIHRNNTGRLPDVNGRIVTFGLAIGSSDLIGSLTVSADVMVGRTFTIARAIAIEVKTRTGTLTEDQERFLAEKRRIGWLTGVVRSVDDARELIEHGRRWER